MDTYIVLNADNQPLSNDNAQHITIQKALENGLKKGEAHDPSSRLIPRVLKHFSAPTNVNFINDSDTQTILEVSSPDRPGMLATIAGILSRFQCVLNAAKITTLGERVEDILFISDQDGNAIGDDHLLNELANTIKRELDQQTEHES